MKIRLLLEKFKPDIQGFLAWLATNYGPAIVASSFLASLSAGFTTYSVVSTYTSINGFGPAATVGSIGILLSAHRWGHLAVTETKE